MLQNILRSIRIETRSSVKTEIAVFELVSYYVKL